MSLLVEDIISATHTYWNNFMQIEDRAILSTWVQHLRSLHMNQDLMPLSLKHDPEAFFLLTGHPL